jgi:hypothetical protein
VVAGPEVFSYKSLRSFDELERKCAEELHIRLEDLNLRVETNYPSN